MFDKTWWSIKKVKVLVWLMGLLIIVICAKLPSVFGDDYQEFNHSKIAIYPDVQRKTPIGMITSGMSCQVGLKQYIGKVDAYRKIKCLSGIQGYVLEIDINDAQ